MSGRRIYTSEAEKALFLLSQGYCYAPGCRTPVLRKINGEPRVNVFIAHIYGRELTAARYDPRDATGSSRWLRQSTAAVQANHDEVDSPPTRAKHPRGYCCGGRQIARASRLSSWKGSPG